MACLFSDKMAIKELGAFAANATFFYTFPIISRYFHVSFSANDAILILMTVE